MSSRPITRKPSSPVPAIRANGRVSPRCGDLRVSDGLIGHRQLGVGDVHPGIEQHPPKQRACAARRDVDAVDAAGSRPRRRARARLRRCSPRSAAAAISSSSPATNVIVAASCASGFARSSPYPDHPTAPYVPIARTSSAGAEAALRNEEGLDAGRILLHRGVGVVHVDVGPEEGERRSRGPPDIEHGGGRASARVLAGGVLAGLRTEPRVRVHRDVGDRPAAGGEVLDVGRDGPGHEDLLGRGGVAEDLRPRSALGAAGGLPEPSGGRAAGGRRAHVRDQLGRHRVVPRRLGQLVAVAAVREQTRLVLDLHHHDRAVGIGIHEVPDERLEGLRVGLAQLRAEDREHRLRGRSLVAEGLHALRFDHDAREPFRVAAHPGGRIRGCRVLERAEPQQHQAKPVRAGLGEHDVDEREVEGPLDRLAQRPAHRREHDVGADASDVRERVRDRFRRRRGRVEHLPADEQGGRAVAAQRERRFGREGPRPCRGGDVLGHDDPVVSSDAGGAAWS